MSDLVGDVLLALARYAIESELGLDTSGEPGRDCDWLEQLGASFVTLFLHMQLRGCIGSLEARRTLREDVKRNALAAAFHDPRFQAVTVREWPKIRIEVSVLGEAQPLVAASESEILSQLSVLRDGVILQAAGRRATFLPQVWEQLPDADVFLRQLKLKAGLPADFRSEDIRLWTYPVEKFRESE